MKPYEFTFTQKVRVGDRKTSIIWIKMFFWVRIMLPWSIIPLFVYFLSIQPIASPIHAIQINDNTYVHGDELTCESAALNNFRCTTRLNGTDLVISINKANLNSDNVSNCQATFAGKSIYCSSYINPEFKT